MCVYIYIHTCIYVFIHTHKPQGTSENPPEASGDSAEIHRPGEGPGERRGHWRPPQRAPRVGAGGHLSSPSAADPRAEPPDLCGYQPSSGTHRSGTHLEVLGLGRVKWKLSEIPKLGKLEVQTWEGNLLVWQWTILWESGGFFGRWLKMAGCFHWRSVTISMEGVRWSRGLALGTFVGLVRSQTLIVQIMETEPSNSELKDSNPKS